MAFCPDTTCSILLNSRCAFYEAASLPYTGIATNDSLQVSLQKIEEVIKNIIDGGGSGAAIWGSITGTLINQADLISYLSATYTPQSRVLTINGTAFDLSANRSWNVGTVTNVAALTLGTTGTDLNSSVATSTTTPIITLNVPTASALNRGVLSSTDWSIFNAKQAALTGAQGDLLYFSALNTISNLVKDTNVTRYLSNTGTSNNPAWSQVSLTTGVTGDLLFANLTQGSARSVLGVTGNATADVAPIQGTTNQILRVNGAGTALAFGSIDLSQSASIGTSILPLINGGTGLATIPALSIWAANTLNALTPITPAAGQSIRINAGNTAWEAYTPSTGSVGGTAAATQVAYGSGVNTLTSEAAFTYTAATNTLNVDNISSTTQLSLSSASGNVNITATGGAINLNAASSVNIEGTITTIESSGGDLTLSANSNAIIDATSGDVVLQTGGLERLIVDADGSWEINGTDGTAGQVLTSNGSGSTPTWQTPTGGVSDGDKGDITVSSSGTVWTIDSNILASGIYTPTLTNVQDITTSTSAQCQYMRVGSVVTVAGRISVTPSTTPGTCQLGISLPIASNFAVVEDCAGTMCTYSDGDQSGGLYADITNNRAQLQFSPVGTTAYAIVFTFTYLII